MELLKQKILILNYPEYDKIVMYKLYSIPSPKFGKMKKDKDKGLEIQ
jgi:hypothetical protein